MFLLTTDLHRVGDLLASAAQTEIMPRFRNLSLPDVQEKLSAFDVVTAADEAAEAVITEGLRAAFPHALIVGEEAAGRDPGLLRSLGAAELAFLLDPIDGTKNFTANLSPAERSATGSSAASRNATAAGWPM